MVALRTGCRGVLASKNVGSYGTPELGIWPGGGQILNMLFGTPFSPHVSRPRGRDESIRIACGVTLSSIVW